MRLDTYDLRRLANRVESLGNVDEVKGTVKVTVIDDIVATVKLEPGTEPIVTKIEQERGR